MLFIHRYGASTGSPSPESNNLDSVTIVTYLKETKHFISFGAHGESIGGMAAVYLAKQNLLEFVVADRTFCNLHAAIPPMDSP